MSKPLIIKLVLGETISSEELYDELYEICSSEHSSCNSNCPVYFLNKNEVPNYTSSDAGCDCFKNGKAMFAFIKNHFR